MGVKFRHSAGFGKRMEFWLIGRMLKEGLDIYVPLVDDRGVDAVIRKRDGAFIEVQIKARSNEVKIGSSGLFAAIDHPQPRKNYFFVFYSERLDATWIMSSEEFIAEANQNKTGINAGRRTVWLNGMKTDKATGVKVEYPRPQFEKYRTTDFAQFPLVTGLGAAPR
jgi:hypothetical protein